MTRFLMSLADSVDLVQFAFENAQSGDLFIKKAPAATVEVLLQALVEMFEINDAIVKSIGIRHGEKVYESLLSTEERVNSEDLGDFFRVPLDTRTLDYSVYQNQYLVVGGQGVLTYLVPIAYSLAQLF